jgi:AcrR family transcriptional regulator
MTARRREVLDEAARLFHERGYMGVSMDHVADAVGLTKGSLYHHFPGKAQILSQIYDEAVDFVLGRVELHDPEASPGETVRLLINDIIVLIKERRYHVTVFYQEMRFVGEWLPASDAKRVQGKMRDYVTYVTDTVRRGIDSGEFEDVDPVVAAYGLIGMASWTYQWYDPRRSRSVDEVTDVFARIYLRGLARG